MAIKLVRTPYGTIEYDLIRKPVKNLNLHVKEDGSIWVSANRYVSEREIARFINANAAQIFRMVERAKARGKRNNGSGAEPNGPNDQGNQKAPVPKRTPKEQRALQAQADAVLRPLVDKYYPIFQKLGYKYPELKYKDVKSYWGQYRPKDHIVTFNLKLLDVPRECQEYVVVHELCHFIELNHSARFWKLVAQIMPDYQIRKKILKKAGFAAFEE